MNISIVGMPAVGKSTAVTLLENMIENACVIRDLYPNSITDILQKTFDQNGDDVQHKIQEIFFNHDLRKIDKINRFKLDYDTIIMDRGQRTRKKRLENFNNLPTEL